MTIIKIMMQRKYQKFFRLLTSVMRDQLACICILNIWKYIDTKGWDITSIKMTPKWLCPDYSVLIPHGIFIYVTIFMVISLLIFSYLLICNMPCLNFNLILTDSMKSYFDHFNSHYLFANLHNMGNPPAIFWLSAILSFCIMHHMHLYPIMDMLTECYIKEVQSICNRTMLGSAEANTRLVFGVQIIY